MSNIPSDIAEIMLSHDNVIIFSMDKADESPLIAVSLKTLTEHTQQALSDMCVLSFLKLNGDLPMAERLERLMSSLQRALGVDWGVDWKVTNLSSPGKTLH